MDQKQILDDIKWWENEEKILYRKTVEWNNDVGSFDRSQYFISHNRIKLLEAKVEIEYLYRKLNTIMINELRTQIDYLNDKLKPPLKRKNANCDAIEEFRTKHHKIN